MQSEDISNVPSSISWNLTVLHECYKNLDEHLRKHLQHRDSRTEWCLRLSQLSRRIEVLSQLRMNDHRSHFPDLIFKHSAGIAQVDDILELQSVLIEAIQAYSGQVSDLLSLKRMRRDVTTHERAEEESVIKDGQLLEPMWERFELRVLDFLIESYFEEISAFKGKTLELKELLEFHESISRIQHSVANWIQSTKTYLASLVARTPRVVNAVDILKTRIKQFSEKIKSFADNFKPADLEAPQAVSFTSGQLKLLKMTGADLLLEWKAMDQILLELTNDVYYFDVGGQG